MPQEKDTLIRDERYNAHQVEEKWAERWQADASLYAAFLRGFAEGATQEIAGAGDELVGVDDLGIERLLARECEQPAGPRGGALRRYC